ncbi:hypothetical protein D3C77_530060 [compost metagenome]
MSTALGQHQPCQRCTGTRRQPPTVVIQPPDARQLSLRLFNDQGTALDPKRPCSAFGNAMPPRILRLPGLPELRVMTCSVSCISKPMQLHTEVLQIAYRGRVLRMTAQQASGGEAEAFAGSCQGVKVIRMRTAKADHTCSCSFFRQAQMLKKLEPLVATDQRVDQVQAQHRQPNAERQQPVQFKSLQRRMGKNIKAGHVQIAATRKQQSNSATGLTPRRAQRVKLSA